MSGTVYVTEVNGQVHELPDTVSLRNRLESHLDPIRESTPEEIAASRPAYDAQLRAAGIPSGAA
jgi:hypothetical protein